jgi:hypothetical protein
VHALGAAGDAARLDDMNKQAKIGQIKTHRLADAFGLCEVKLRLIPIVSSHGGIQIRETRR